jgi:hypothetical protein
MATSYNSREALYTASGIFVNSKALLALKSFQQAFQRFLNDSKGCTEKRAFKATLILDLRGTNNLLYASFKVRSVQLM